MARYHLLGSRIRILVFFLPSLSVFLYAPGQQTVPDFNITHQTIYIPAFLPGISNDPTAILQNDTLIYKLDGQFFPKAFPFKTGKTFNSQATPWQTIIEMADAFLKLDRPRIIGLYDAGSKPKISNLLSMNRSSAYLGYVNKASRANLRILGGMNYQNGFLAFTKDDLYGLHENFMIKEKNQYKLSALEDESPAGWNIGLYLKYEPGPMTVLNDLAFPESLGLEDSVHLTVTLPGNGRWVTIFTGVPGAPVSLLAQDNGINDLDPAPGKMLLQFRGSLFMLTGEHVFFVRSFNYPVQRVSQNFISTGGRYKIKIK
jgi:hypothetical protein